MYSDAQILSQLAGEPWRVTPAQYRDLTDWQIANVYFRRKDGRGMGELPPGFTPAPDFATAARAACRAKGWKEPEFING